MQPTVSGFGPTVQAPRAATHSPAQPGLAAAAIAPTPTTACAANITVAVLRTTRIAQANRRRERCERAAPSVHRVEPH
jgi:hypothetical protein